MQSKIRVKVDKDIRELIPRFLQSMNNKVRLLREALQNSDYVKIYSLGHQLKGIGGPYGFERISQLGALVDEYAKNENRQKLEEAVKELALYLEAVEVFYE